MLDWLKRRREQRARVEAEAKRLIAEHGYGAYAAATTAARAPGPDWRFHDAVRREVMRRHDVRPGVDNATRRFLEGHG